MSLFDYEYHLQKHLCTCIILLWPEGKLLARIFFYLLQYSGSSELSSFFLQWPLYWARYWARCYYLAKQSRVRSSLFSLRLCPDLRGFGLKGSGLASILFMSCCMIDKLSTYVMIKNIFAVLQQDTGHKLGTIYKRNYFTFSACIISTHHHQFVPREGSSEAWWSRC